MSALPHAQPTTRLPALADGHCQNGAPRLDAAEIAVHLATLRGRTMEDQRIEKRFLFSAYRQTITFVNPVTGIAERENHHPDLSVHYDRCVA